MLALTYFKRLVLQAATNRWTFLCARALKAGVDCVAIKQIPMLTIPTRNSRAIAAMTWIGDITSARVQFDKSLGSNFGIETKL